jgi:hypothetical protein
MEISGNLDSWNWQSLLILVWETPNVNLCHFLFQTKKSLTWVWEIPNAKLQFVFKLRNHWEHLGCWEIQMEKWNSIQTHENPLVWVWERFKLENYNFVQLKITHLGWRDSSGNCVWKNHPLLGLRDPNAGSVQTKVTHLQICNSFGEI